MDSHGHIMDMLGLHTLWIPGEIVLDSSIDIVACNLHPVLSHVSRVLHESTHENGSIGGKAVYRGHAGRVAQAV
jgi:AICAR transformylase/IMP cyclohydrolase PurH